MGSIILSQQMNFVIWVKVGESSVCISEIFKSKKMTQNRKWKDRDWFPININ